MLSKSQIKLIRSLEYKKYRNEYGLFVAEGNKVVKEFLDNKWETYLIACTETWAKQNTGVSNPIICDKSILKKISFLKTPSDVVGVFYQKKQNEIPNIETSLGLALDNIQDAGNVGTILRIALWFGINYVLLGDGCADMYHPKVVQASMGALAKINCKWCKLSSFLEQYHNKIITYGTFLDGKPIYNANLSHEGLIVFGNEGKGITPCLEPYIHQRLFIPPYNSYKAIDSLNVAMSAAIVCYEFRRK